MEVVPYVPLSHLFTVYGVLWLHVQPSEQDVTSKDPSAISSSCACTVKATPPSWAVVCVHAPFVRCWHTCRLPGWHAIPEYWASTYAVLSELPGGASSVGWRSSPARATPRRAAKRIARMA